MEKRFELLEKYQETIKETDIGLFVLTGSLLSGCYDSVFGFENFMIMLYDDMDLIEEILEMYTVVESYTFDMERPADIFNDSLEEKPLVRNNNGMESSEIFRRRKWQ